MSGNVAGYKSPLRATFAAASGSRCRSVVPRLVGKRTAQVST
jgi:hypothetical protein